MSSGTTSVKGGQALTTKLPAAPDHDLRHTPVVLNQPSSTDMRPCARQLPYVLPVIPPNEDGEYLIGIGGVQIDKGRLPPGCLPQFSHWQQRRRRLFALRYGSWRLSQKLSELSSVVTSKAAIRGHFKTGHRDW